MLFDTTVIRKGRWRQFTCVIGNCTLLRLRRRLPQSVTDVLRHSLASSLQELKAVWLCTLLSLRKHLPRSVTNVLRHSLAASLQELEIGGLCTQYALIRLYVRRKITIEFIHSFGQALKSIEIMSTSFYLYPLSCYNSP